VRIFGRQAFDKFGFQHLLSPRVEDWLFFSGLPLEPDVKHDRKRKHVQGVG